MPKYENLQISRAIISALPCEQAAQRPDREGDQEEYRGMVEELW